MCLVCVSTVAVVSLISPSEVPVVKNNTTGYTVTKSPCPKSKLNKIEKNRICLKDGRVYRWAVKKTTPNNTSKPDVPLQQTPTTTVIQENKPVVNNSMVYDLPSTLSDNIQSCKIKENNTNRVGAINSQLPTGFPGFTHAKKEGTVKWALIPLDFPDVTGEQDIKSRVDDQMIMLSDWFETVSEGKFKVEWVFLDKWVTLPNASGNYKIERSDNIDRVANGVKLWNDAMMESDKVFDFTGIQTVNFILPKSQDIIQETLQGFPWDPAVKNLTTNEGKVSSFSMPGKFMNHPSVQYWSYWAHEFGHAMALPHVGSSREPNPFLGLDIMGNQDGESRELSGWMRFVAGWLPDEKVYCKELNQLTTTTVTLNPLSKTGDGIKMIVIPTSQTKAVVIESRRENKFSCKMPSDRNGILVYTYDSTLSHGENFLKPITPSGRVPENSLNCRAQPYPNPILYKGQTISIDGVRIEVIESLNYDKIKIYRD
jgi:M6 family metalloprotease-like protein